MSWHVPLLFSASMINYPSRRRKIKPRYKANSMIQWIEHNRNKTFINLPSLHWKFEISGAVHLVQLGLTAGRQACRQVNFDFFKKIHCVVKPSNFCFFKSTYRIIRAVIMYSRWFFQVKLILRPFLRCENLRNHIISYQPLLYSTTVH